MDENELIKKAFEAQRYSYAPYSNFHVGAALMDVKGNIYFGCNIENAAYSPSNCAERTAFFKAISEGVQEFKAIAVVGNPIGKEAEDYIVPCGVCRQVMAEFCDPVTFKIYLAKNMEEYKVFTLNELLPFSFTNKNLQM